MTDILAEEKLLNSSDPSMNTSLRLSKLKIDYLSQQKQKIQTELSELHLNNKLLRKINQQILKSQSIQQKDILQRNQQLEISYKKLSKENKKLKTCIFLAQQIKIDQEKDNSQIVQNYQNKILQLRRLVQAKQSYVQMLEHSQGYDSSPYLQTICLQANTNNMHFYEKMQQMKQYIQHVEKQNIKLKHQNDELRLENNKRGQKICKMQNLLACRISFLQYKNIINEKQSKSLPKSKVCIQFSLPPSAHDITDIGKINKSWKTNGQSSTAAIGTKGRFKQTNVEQISTQYVKQCSKLVEVGKIISKKCHENNKLLEQLRNQKIKLEQYKLQIEKLKQSLVISQKKRKNIIQKMNFYISTSKNLLLYLSMRKINKIENQRKIFDDHDCDVMRNFKKSLGQIQKTIKYQKISKQQWQQISKQLKINNPPQKQSTHLKRSYSSILDYIRTKPLILQKVSLDNPLQNSIFQISDISLIMNDSQQPQTVSIIAASTSMGNSKNKISRSIRDEKPIFDNVLENL